MAETPSSFFLNPGDTAPDFTLPDLVSGSVAGLSRLRGERGTLVFFACNHCPYVVLLAKALGEWAQRVAVRGVATVAINSNNVELYPADAPDKMSDFARKNGWSFPYLYDEPQEVAHAYGAACTPDFFLLDGEGRLFYAGQFDDARPGNGREVTGRDLDAALECLLEGRPAPVPFKPSLGCNIKWKPGNEPRFS